MMRRNQSVVKYVTNSNVRFGIVKDFIQFRDALDTVRNVALLTPLECSYTNEDKIHAVIHHRHILDVVELPAILNECMLVEVDQASYVCEIVNRYDRD